MVEGLEFGVVTIEFGNFGVKGCWVATGTIRIVLAQVILVIILRQFNQVIIIYVRSVVALSLE